MEPKKPIVSMWLWITLLVVVLFAGGFFAWYYLMGPGKVTTTSTPTPTTTTTDTSATAGWNLYANNNYLYTIKYPKAWTYAPAKTVGTSTELEKNASIVFSKTSAAQLTLNSVDKTKYAGVTLSQFASDYVTPKDKATITGKTAAKVGSLEGFQELVTITDPASKGMWYFAEGTKYFFVFITTEAAQSTDIKNMLSTFAQTTSTVSGFQKYINTFYNYSIDHPTTWTWNAEDPKVVTMDSPETAAAIKIDRPNTEGTPHDITIYYYPSVAEERMNVENKYGATTLAEFMAKNAELTNVGDTKLGGVAAKDAVINGLGAYYTVFAVNNNHLYEIQFGNVSDKTKLTAVDTQILSTFKFLQ